MSIYGLGRPWLDEGGRRRDLKDWLEYIETEAALAESESKYGRRTLGPTPVVRYEVPKEEEG